MQLLRGQAQQVPVQVQVQLGLLQSQVGAPPSQVQQLLRLS